MAEEGGGQQFMGTELKDGKDGTTPPPPPPPPPRPPSAEQPVQTQPAAPEKEEENEKEEGVEGGVAGSASVAADQTKTGASSFLDPLQPEDPPVESQVHDQHEEHQPKAPMPPVPKPPPEGPNNGNKGSNANKASGSSGDRDDTGGAKGSGQYNGDWYSTNRPDIGFYLEKDAPQIVDPGKGPPGGWDDDFIRNSVMYVSEGKRGCPNHVHRMEIYHKAGFTDILISYCETKPEAWFGGRIGIEAPIGAKLAHLTNQFKGCKDLWIPELPQNTSGYVRSVNELMGFYDDFGNLTKNA